MNAFMGSNNETLNLFADLNQISIRLVLRSEFDRYKSVLEKEHYLGCPAFIGHSLHYVAVHNNNWVALLSFSAAALKCKSRDGWIGWCPPYQWQRLHLIANNTRFLILPSGLRKNLASKVLSLCLKRISQDWLEHFGHPLLMVETFVDPDRFKGTCYLANGWLNLGQTKGFQKINRTYVKHDHPKLVFVKLLHRRARQILRFPILDEFFKNGVAKMTLNKKQVKSLFECIKKVKDPRSLLGLRHHMLPLMAVCVCAVLCGAAGYSSIADWAKNLTKTMRKKLRLRKEGKEYIVPSESTIRRFLMNLEPNQLNSVLNSWTQSMTDEKDIAIDGKTMRGTSKKKGTNPRFRCHDT
jgi:hypothetical protein